MATTYVPLYTTTLASDTANVTISSISSSYTDLVLIVNGGLASQAAMVVQINSDTGTNYSVTRIYGDGTTASSDKFSSQNYLDLGFFQANLNNNAIINFMNYGNTTTYKTVLSRWNTPAYTAAVIGLWRNTGAISTIKLYNATGVNLKSGTTFSLYGIANAAIAGGAKATGGDIVTTDGTYWYHAFRGSGTFTPSVALTADVLVIAGGGSSGASTGGNYTSGGGGAGGYLKHTSQSLTATNYTVTIGGGGTGASVGTNNGNQGSNSQFASLTASVGGGFGGANGSGNGGSGGGSSVGNATGGTATSGQGFAGGGGGPGANNYTGGGGGGAGAIGSNGTSTNGGAGGAGKNTDSSWLNATGTGVSGFIAGGGGGASWGAGLGGAGGSGGGGLGGGNSTQGAGVSATANTGSGGGGGGNGYAGASGGSGLVIVRYTV